MTRKSQEEHLTALIDLSGLKLPKGIPGFRNFPPTRFERLIQELGALKSIGMCAFKLSSVSLTGKQLKHVYGTITIDFNPTIKNGILSILNRKTVIPIHIDKNQNEPFSILSHILHVDTDETVKANIGFNSILVLFAKIDGESMVIHIPINSEGKLAVQRHLDGLEQAKHQLRNTSVSDLIPDPTRFYQRDEHTALVQSLKKVILPCLVIFPMKNSCRF